MRNRTCQHVTMLKLTWTIDPCAGIIPSPQSSDAMMTYNCLKPRCGTIKGDRYFLALSTDCVRVRIAVDIFFVWRLRNPIYLPRVCTSNDRAVSNTWFKCKLERKYYILNPRGYITSIHYHKLWHHNAICNLNFTSLAIPVFPHKSTFKKKATLSKCVWSRNRTNTLIILTNNYHVFFFFTIWEFWFFILCIGHCILIIFLH